MSEDRHSTILTGFAGNQPVIKPQGPCTFASCTRLAKFLQAYRKPATNDLYFELSDVSWIDSTFAGFLVSLATKRQAPDCPDLHLIAPSQGVLQALEQMHLVTLFDVVSAPKEEITEWKTLPAEDGDKHRTGDMIINCHERLIEADARNAKTFGPIVESFKADRNRMKSSDGE